MEKKLCCCLWQKINEEINGLSWQHWLLANKHKGGYRLVVFFGCHGVYCRQDREWDNTVEKMLKMFSMFQISCWYNKGHNDQNRVELISIRCSTCGKEARLSMDNINTKYKDIIT